MALSLPGERSVAAATPNPFAAILRWIALARAARARRAALSALLELDHWLLEDLGVSSADVAEAIASNSRAGAVLNTARARNARS